MRKTRAQNGMDFHIYNVKKIDIFTLAVATENIGNGIGYATAD